MSRKTVYQDDHGGSTDRASVTASDDLTPIRDLWRAVLSGQGGDSGRFSSATFFLVTGAIMEERSCSRGARYE
jgi:hypothetical protein